MEKKGFAVVLILFAIAFLSACEVQDYTVEGYARDACSDQPIAGATVTLQRAGTTLTRVTDSTGYYVFDTLDNEDYTLIIAQDGYDFYPGQSTVSFSQLEQEKTVGFAALNTSDAWKKEAQGLTYVYFSGTPEQIGCQHGTMLKEELQAFSEMAAPYAPTQQEINFLMAYWEPQFRQRELDEMQAIATASGISYGELLALNTKVDLNKLGDTHCSGFAAIPNATSDNNIYQGFNWDSTTESAVLRASNSVLAFYSVRDENGNAKNDFVAPIMVGSVGVFTGMNNQQISVDTQAASRMNDESFNGYAFRPLTSLVRQALEDAATIDQMTAIMTDTETAYRYPGLISIISSGNENTAVALEIVGAESVVRPVQNNVVWAANNLQAEDYWATVTGVDCIRVDGRADEYKQLLYGSGTPVDPGLLYGFVDVNTAISTILKNDTICVQGNGTSLVYVPKEGHIHVSTLVAPTCEQSLQDYIGFDLNTKSPL